MPGVRRGRDIAQPQDMARPSTRFLFFVLAVVVASTFNSAVYLSKTRNARGITLELGDSPGKNAQWQWAGFAAYTLPRNINETHSRPPAAFTIALLYLYLDLTSRDCFDLSVRIAPSKESFFLVIDRTINGNETFRDTTYKYWKNVSIRKISISHCFNQDFIKKNKYALVIQYAFQFRRVLVLETIRNCFFFILTYRRFMKNCMRLLCHIQTARNWRLYAAIR